QQRCDTLLVLQYQMDTAILYRGVNAFCNLVQDVVTAGINHGVRSVESQAIDVKLARPIHRILHNELAYLAVVRPIKVQTWPPCGFVCFAENLREVSRNVIAFGTKVVIDDVENHHDAARMRSIDECFQVLRPPISCIRRIELHTVIPPAALSSERANTHQFYCGDTELLQMIQSINRRAKGPIRCKCADVELVNHGLIPRT